MKYEVVRAGSVTDLEKIVNSYIEKGYLPTGGIMYHQSMLLKKKKTMKISRDAGSWSETYVKGPNG